MDYINKYLTPAPRTPDTRNHILSLPQAHKGDKPLYYGREGCKRENIAIVEDDAGTEWVRGRGNLRYGVLRTFSDILGPFTRLDSGKNGR